ncbi:hypothetical protein [Xanthomonas axonopodis]
MATPAGTPGGVGLCTASAVISLSAGAPSSAQAHSGFFLEIFTMSTIHGSTASPHPDGMPHAFDESSWRTVCDEVATRANKGCGLSHDYYVACFSSTIDTHARRLPPDQREQALKIAREWDYATPAERRESQMWNAENGYCSHGIELGCCPAGCGSD